MKSDRGILFWFICLLDLVVSNSRAWCKRSYTSCQKRQPLEIVAVLGSKMLLSETLEKKVYVAALGVID